MKIKNNVKKYRIFKGLTRKQLSEKINVSVSRLSRIENQYYYPAMETRLKICNFFNVKETQMWNPEDFYKNFIKTYSIKIKLLQIKLGQELYTNDSGFEKIQKITNIHPQDPNLIYKIENDYNGPGFYNVKIDYIDKTVFTDAIYLEIKKSKMGKIMEDYYKEN